MAEGTELATVAVRMVLDSSALDQGLSRVTRRFSRFRGAIEGFQEELEGISNAALAVGVALGAGLTPGVVAAQRLEQALARSFSVGELTEETMHSLRAEVLSLGQSVIGPVQLAEGLYNLASAGLDADQQMKVLPVTMQLAVASAVDLDTASQLLVQC